MKADSVTPSDVLTREGVRLGRSATDKQDAIRQCGALLVEIGAVGAPYADAMQERERSISTYVGEGIAIPHGTDESRVHVRRTALAVITFPDGVDWDGSRVLACVAIAAAGSEHVALLSALADVLLEPDQAAALRSARTADEVLALLAPHPEESNA